MPVTTRRQAQQQIKQAHAESHTNLNNLPAEILQEIAYHLNPDVEDAWSDKGSKFSDIEYDRQSVVSVEPDQGPPEVEVVPCCRDGDEKKIASGAGIPILDDRSTFSTVSRRIRDVVWNRRQKRCRTIRYCDRWIQDTMQVSEATRSRHE
jgi:hypothetical protein